MCLTSERLKSSKRSPKKSLISARFLFRFFPLLACNFTCNKQKNRIARLLIPHNIVYYSLIIDLGTSD